MSVRRARGSRWFAIVAIGAALGAGGVIAACGSDGQDAVNNAGADGSADNVAPPSQGTPDGAIGVSDASTFNPLCGDASADAEIDCTGKCGPVRDLCSGKVKECGGCQNAVTADGGDGGVQVCDLEKNVCGTPKITCADLGAECGTLKNSCGIYLDCPDGLPKGCATGKECDPDTHKCRDCQQVTCADLGIECGLAWLGCGTDSPENYTDCGGCAADDAGARRCNTQFNKCEPSCTPKTAAEICNDAKSKKGVQCGVISDGCGGTVNCDSVPTFGCPAGQSCGVRGIGNRCDPQATPDECVALGRNCGQIKSACTGATINCGDCATGQVCNSNGVCGAACAPKTCDDYKEFQCGVFDDGCGSTITCGCAGGGVCNNTTNTCCGSTKCTDPTLAGKCGDNLPNGCGQNVLDCDICTAGTVCTTDGGAAPAPPSSSTGLCCSPRASTFYTNQGQCGTKLANGCGQNTINASCPANELCVNNNTGSAGPTPPDGTVGTCCTRTDTCTQAAQACAPVQNSCRPPGTLVDCSGNCKGDPVGTLCANNVCCLGAAACAGGGGEGGECNTVHTPGDPGCGQNKTCGCVGGRTCWCPANGTNPVPHVCVTGEVADVGACKTALSCNSTVPAYKGHCGTALDNGIGGTINCACGNGQVCTTSAPNTTGTCQCNNPTHLPYTCANVPNGPGSPGGDACGTFDNGCGGTVTCGCSVGGQICDTANNPNTCCAPTACPTPALGSACGQMSNGCGGNNSCGCPGGTGNENYTCTAGQCACVKDTCRGRTGPQPDRCGGTLDCKG